MIILLPKLLIFHYNAYTQQPIAYDFIVKMQQRIWNGILDTYLNNYIYTDRTSISSVQKYDRDSIYSTMLFPNQILNNIYLFKLNLINWAKAQGFIVNDNCVNVIDDEKNNQVIIHIVFSL